MAKSSQCHFHKACFLQLCNSWAMDLFLLYKHCTHMSSFVHQLSAAYKQASTSLLHSHFNFSSKARKVAKVKGTCTSDKGWAWLHYKQLHKLVSRRNTKSKDPKHSQTEKTYFSAQALQFLQNTSHLNICSCVLLCNTSNIFHTSYLNYPSPCPGSVSPISDITIFILEGCRLTRAGSFSHPQGQLSIGIAWGNFKEAHTILRPHSKSPHCHIQIQLDKVFFKTLSLYLGILKLWFVKQRCSP